MSSSNYIYKLNNEHGNIDTSFNYFLKFKIDKDAQILDLGCGYGSLVYNIFCKGYNNIYGIDINEDKIKTSYKHYNVLKSNILHYPGNTIPFKNNKFDVILCFDVLEHIRNINNFLRNEVVRTMKTNALFIFSTPNKYINIPWEIINRKSFTEYRKYHCSLQNIRSLKKILEYAGFKDIIIEKNSIITTHNKNKVNKKLGATGPLLLYLLQMMPLPLFPNFWGSCRKA